MVRRTRRIRVCDTRASCEYFRNGALPDKHGSGALKWCECNHQCRGKVG